MKFVKTIKGDYVNANFIKDIHIDTLDDGSCYVAARVNWYCEMLKIFSCDPKSTTQFDPRAEAQAWLDNLVTKLNGEESE